MPFTTAKTNWVDNEIVLPEDLNRIEANVDAANKSNYEFVVFNGPAYAMGTALSTFYEPAMNVIHTSRTGKVRLTASVCFLNTSGATRNFYLSLARDGVNLLRNKPNGLARGFVLNNTYHTVTVVFIAGDAPIGAPSDYNLLVREPTGVIILAGSHLLAEDV